jgi:hypothetical protein
VQAEAAATLMGLVFVAVSINLQKIMSFPGLPGRAGESILQLFQVFLISTVCLVPEQSSRTLAIEVLAISLSSWIVQLVMLRSYLRIMGDHPKSWITYRAALSQLATIPFLVAGLMLLEGSETALYWLVPGFVFSFVAAVISAWVLLVEILR